MSNEEQKSLYQTEAMTGPKALGKKRKWLKWVVALSAVVLLIGTYFGIQFWGWYTGALSYPVRWDELSSSKKEMIRGLEGYSEFGEPVWYYEYPFPYPKDDFILISRERYDSMASKGSKLNVNDKYVGADIASLYGVTIDRKGSLLNPSIVSIHKNHHHLCDTIKVSAWGNRDQQFMEEMNALIVSALEEEQLEWYEAANAANSNSNSSLQIQLQRVDPSEYEEELADKTEWWESSMRPLKWVYSGELTSLVENGIALEEVEVQIYDDGEWIQDTDYEGHVWLNGTPPFTIEPNETVQFLIPHYWHRTEMPPHIYTFRGKDTHGKDFESRLAVYHESQRE